MVQGMCNPHQGQQQVDHMHEATEGYQQSASVGEQVMQAPCCTAMHVAPCRNIFCWQNLYSAGTLLLGNVMACPAGLSVSLCSSAKCLLRRHCEQAPLSSSILTGQLAR